LIAKFLCGRNQVGVEFLHISDIHLGYQQYNHQERFKDFGRAFLSAVNYAIEEKVDFALICGDLFNKSALDAPTLFQAVTALEKLESANIKAIAIAGNHDRATHQDAYSWLHYLNERGHLILLSPEYLDAGVSFPLYNGKSGGYYEIKGVQIYGLPYLGSATEPVLSELPSIISSSKNSENPFTIVMAHFGLKGEIPGMPGGVSREQIAQLQEHVDYLALGHWHKPYEYDDWIYNPGSLESCAMNERNWDGGFYHVVINDEIGHKHEAIHIECERRPFYRFKFEVDTYSTPEGLVEGFDQYLINKKEQILNSKIAPVIEVCFEGILSFDRSSLELEKYQLLVESVFSPLIVRLKNNTRPSEFEISADANLPRIQLEHQILQELFQQDSQYQEHAESWADLAIEIKSLVLKDEQPDSIVSALRSRVRQIEAKE